MVRSSDVRKGESDDHTEPSREGVRANPQWPDPVPHDGRPYQAQANLSQTRRERDTSPIAASE